MPAPAVDPVASMAMPAASSRPRAVAVAYTRQAGAYLMRLLSLLITADLLAMVILTVTDVVGRYFLSRPVPGALEMTEMLLGALIFTALPLVTLRGEHVVIDLLDNVVPARLVKMQAVIAALLSSACCAYLAYRLWLLAERLHGAGETTATLSISMAPFAYGVSLFVGITSIAALATVIVPPPSDAGTDGHV